MHATSVKYRAPAADTVAESCFVLRLKVCGGVCLDLPLVLKNISYIGIALRPSGPSPLHVAAIGSSSQIRAVGISFPTLRGLIGPIG